MVLVQNNGGVLPLKPGVKLAVIGANADDLGVLEANYHGTAAAPVTPLEGLRARFGADHVTYAQGSVLAEGAPVILPETALSAGGKPGLAGQYRDAAGKLVLARQDRRIDFNFTRSAPEGLDPQRFSASWSGMLVPPGPGPGAWRSMRRNAGRIATATMTWRCGWAGSSFTPARWAVRARNSRSPAMARRSRSASIWNTMATMKACACCGCRPPGRKRPGRWPWPRMPT
jgi:hypothetical protein